MTVSGQQLVSLDVCFCSWEFSCKGRMHPFGKEDTASLEHLFGFFCECVRRGDWELAQACVPQLHQWQGDDSEKVEEILHALITCPSQLR